MTPQHSTDRQIRNLMIGNLVIFVGFKIVTAIAIRRLQKSLLEYAETLPDD